MQKSLVNNNKTLELTIIFGRREFFFFFRSSSLGSCLASLWATVRVDYGEKQKGGGTDFGEKKKLARKEANGSASIGHLPI